jgi:hypothetical protein
MTAVMEEEPSRRDWARTAVWGLVIGYFVLAVFVFFAFQAQGEEADDRVESDRRIVVAQTVLSCEDRNHTKKVLRETIDAALAGGGGIGDLTKVPGFDELDPDTQEYFRNLMAGGSDSQSSGDRLRAYRDSLIDEDCKALGRKLSAELEEADG